MNTKKREQFRKEGYCLFENILDADMVERLRNMSDGGEAVGQHDEKPPHY